MRGAYRGSGPDPWPFSPAGSISHPSSPDPGSSGACHHRSSLRPHFQTLPESSSTFPQTALICAFLRFPSTSDYTDPYSHYSSLTLETQDVLYAPVKSSPSSQRALGKMRIVRYSHFNSKQPSPTGSSILALVLTSPGYPKAGPFHILCRNLLWFL